MGGFGGNIAGGGDVIWNGIIMVDPVNGDDGTGERNNISKPFATLGAAYTVYQDGDLIDILPGTLTFTATLNLNSAFPAHINFRSGAKITGNFNDELITSSQHYHIYGDGEFRNDNASFSSGSSIFSGPVWIHSARKISSGPGAIFLFSTAWLNIENVEEIFNERTSGICISFVNQPLHAEERYGNIRNCKKIGDPAYSSVGISVQSQNSDVTLYVENSNFYSNNQVACSLNQNSDNHAVFQNCVFKSEDTRACVISSKAEFNNCHFITNDNIVEAVGITNLQFETNGYMPTFTNCTFRSNGIAPALRSFEPANFYGVNRMVTNGADAVSGNGDNFNKNHGTIIANVMDAVDPAQSWTFRALENSPTVGETYTITAPDAATITYVVQPADTRTEVINGLVAAWDAEVIAEPNGFFAKFDNKTSATGPTFWQIIATAIDANDDVPPSPGFVLSTDGTDSVTTILTETNAFAWKGAGKFLIDENVIIPNY
jgi:hypothetical protein